MLLFHALLACTTPETPSERPRRGPDVAAFVESLLDRDRVTRRQDAVAWQRSSTDPRATSPDAPDWFANEDRGHVLRFEDGRYVLLDESGPGVLTRLWSANPERGGVLSVYVDGSRLPALQAPMEDLLAGRDVVPQPFATLAGGGYTLRLPIPYEERLVVTMDENRGKGVYWVAQGLKLPEGRPVASFRSADLEEARPALERARRALVDPEPGEGSAITGTIADLAPGAASDGVSVQGPAAIRALTVSLDRPDAGMDVWLVASFDGVQSVEVPLGGLLGAGRATSGYADAWREVQVTAERWSGVSHFPMPFAAEATLVLQNRGEAPVRAELQAISAPYAVDGDSLRFTATQRASDIRTQPRTDWTLAEWTGPGVLVADALTVTNPVEAWWGGGDEKIWVDGVLQRGTGTEDYFGLAWCGNAVFHGPFGGQARNDRVEQTEDACAHSGGVRSLARARGLDVLPFRDTLRFDLGVRHREDTTVRYEGTAVGYAGRLLRD